MNVIRKASVLFFLFCYLIAGSQVGVYSNTKEKSIRVDTVLLIADSLTIIPQTVLISYGDSLLAVKKDFVVDNNRIFLKDDIFEKIKNDSLHIKYKTLGVNLGKMYYHLDTNALAKARREVYIGYDMGKRKDRVPPLVPGGLDYDGSYTRGFSIGNRQSLVLNSNLNLQMSGDIGNGLMLKAAISDANIPIQPEGTTQRLNEFDKVFIEISKNDHSVLAGDFELPNPKGHFIRYFKKLKGLKYDNKIKLKNKKYIASSTGLAVSKGKFARNELKVTNGNQGPYKLYGSGGERFLIILSGTEKVYLDGRLLKRGMNYDYTIDYNLAELRFTPKIMITENSRVIVEFEYSDQNYLRTLEASNVVYGDSTKSFYVNFYNEMDSKNYLGVLDLDSVDIEILKNAGDEYQNTFRSGIRPVDKEALVSQEQILYKKRWEPSIMDSVLVYTSNPDSAKYFAYFSEVGENKGSYDIDNTKLLNGRVYKWVGLNQGKYEPVLRLIPPEKQQLVATGANIMINRNTGIHAEMSFSNFDKNRFSPLDDNDNQGFAGFVSFDTKQKSVINNKTLTFEGKSQYEFTGEHYNALNPYRPPEFTRDWSLPNTNSVIPGHLVKNAVGLKYSDLELQYDYSGFFRKGLFTGHRHIPKLRYRHGGFSVVATIDYLTANDNTNTMVFQRPELDISNRFAFLKGTRLGFSFKREKNSVTPGNTDSLAERSFYFDNYKFYLDTKHSRIFNLKLYSSLRKDYAVYQGGFTSYTDAIRNGLEGNWKWGNFSTLKFDLSVRKLNILNTAINKGQKPETNILGKLLHNLYLFKGGIKVNTVMEFGSGQLAKSEFVFIKVKKGEGSYVWIDTDKDEKQDKDEFFIIPGVDSADYVKVIQYNNEFIRTNSTMFAGNIRVEGKKLLQGAPETKFNNFISKLSLISYMKMTRKTRPDDDTYFLSVFKDLRDTSLVSYNLSFNSTLFFNRGDPAYDIRLGVKKLANKPVHLEGYVIYGLDEYSGAVKYSYKSNLDAMTKIAAGNRNYESQFSLNRNYSFDYIQLNQELNFIFNRKLGAKLVYSFWNKKNRIGEKEKALLHDINLTGKILNVNKFNFNISFSYVNIDFTGKKDTPVELAMLDGLKSGNNFLWNIRINKRMKNNLDLILQYDGRKTEGNRTIHTAKMQARATF